MKEPKKLKITPEGYEQIQKELKKLYTEKRVKIIEDLKIAYDFGDLRENSEFDAAKDAQRNCDNQIKRIENLLNHMEIVTEKEKNIVSIGTTVTIEYLADNEKETYKIVSPLEVSPSENKISNESPMGKALYGSKLNDIVEINSPIGKYKIKIIDIF